MKTRCRKCRGLVVFREDKFFTIKWLQCKKCGDLVYIFEEDK